MGSTQRTCQVTGMWSGSTPTCQGMLLLELEYLVHAYRDNAWLKNLCELRNTVGPVLIVRI